MGWLTDRGDINRRTLLFWVVVIGEFPCLLTYWVSGVQGGTSIYCAEAALCRAHQTYASFVSVVAHLQVKEFWQFFLLRALTGVAVGGCFPLVFSLLGDLFPPRKRAAISAVVQIATGVGLAVGQALSGAVGPATNWRVPFVVVAAPSLLVAVVMQLTTREPPRGAFEEALQERWVCLEAQSVSRTGRSMMKPNLPGNRWYLCWSKCLWHRWETPMSHSCIKQV